MEDLIDAAAPARTFIELLKAVVDDLVSASGSNLKKVLGPKIQPVWSEWLSLQLGISEGAFERLLVELDAVKGRPGLPSGDQAYALLPFKISRRRIDLCEAFVGYRAYWDARQQQPRAGAIAGTMRPSRSEDIIARNLAAIGFALGDLRKPDYFLDLVNGGILGRSHAGQYGAATTLGHALAIFLDHAHKRIGPISAGRLAWMKGYTHFQLLFNGLHSQNLTTVEYARRGLAAADVDANRTVHAMRLHGDNLIAQLTGRSPDMQLALSALDLRSAAGSLPLLPNVDRAIRRRATLDLVKKVGRLDYKPDGTRSLESLLISYRDEAIKIGAGPSVVVDNIGLMEEMIRHGRLRDAIGFHWEAQLAFEEGRTHANERLMTKATQMLRDAQAGKKLLRRD